MTKTLNLHPPLSTLKERMKHTPKTDQEKHIGMAHAVIPLMS